MFYPNFVNLKKVHAYQFCRFVIFETTSIVKITLFKNTGR